MSDSYQVSRHLMGSIFGSSKFPPFFTDDTSMLPSWFWDLYRVVPAAARWTQAEARNLIDGALTQQRVADVLGEDSSARVLDTNRTEISAYVDQLCDYPDVPTDVPLAVLIPWYWWLLPGWPVPPVPPVPPNELSGADLLAAGAEFHRAAERLAGQRAKKNAGHALHAEFAAAADRLFEAGLARLAKHR